MKIGFLLGSFDPIHIGHMSMATSVLNEQLVDKVLFVPTKQNPWKSKSTNFFDRGIMIMKALYGLENCEICPIEWNIESPNYSYKTLQLLKEYYFNDELYLILGADTALNIINWENSNWIVDNYKIITISREGCGIKTDVQLDLNISSTKIRNLAKDNKILYPLVPLEVENYIKQNNLYKNE